MIEKLKCTTLSYYTEDEIINKINEIIDHINKIEKRNKWEDEYDGK